MLLNKCNKNSFLHPPKSDMADRVEKTERKRRIKENCEHITLSYVIWSQLLISYMNQEIFVEEYYLKS